MCTYMYANSYYVLVWVCIHIFTNKWLTISRQQNKCVTLKLWKSSNCDRSNSTATFTGCNHRLGSPTHVTQLCGSRETSWVSMVSSSFPPLKPFYWPSAFSENMQIQTQPRRYLRWSQVLGKCKLCLLTLHCSQWILHWLKTKTSASLTYELSSFMKCPIENMCVCLYVHIVDNICSSQRSVWISLIQAFQISW